MVDVMALEDPAPPGCGDWLREFSAPPGLPRNGRLWPDTLVLRSPLPFGLAASGASGDSLCSLPNGNRLLGELDLRREASFAVPWDCWGPAFSAPSARLKSGNRHLGASSVGLGPLWAPGWVSWGPEFSVAARFFETRRRRKDTSKVRLDIGSNVLMTCFFVFATSDAMISASSFGQHVAADYENVVNGICPSHIV